MKNDIEEQKKKTFYWRFPSILIIGIIMTYGLLNLFLRYGNMGILLAGVILGGLWGEI